MRLDLGDGDVLAYEQAGAGPDIVWVSGADQRGAEWHHDQLPAFVDTHRCTTYDLRGVGETVCSRPTPWTVRDLAADCAALIRAACAPPVVVVGLSLGACVVQQLCADAPELVRCAILLGTGIGANGFAREWEAAEIAHRRAGGTLPEALAVVHYAPFMYPPQALADADVWARVRPVVERAYARRDGALLAAQWETLADFDAAALLARCPMPVHVVSFEHDLQTPARYGPGVAALAPDGHHHLLEGLGHCSAFGHRPDVVNAKIREIVEGCA